MELTHPPAGIRGFVSFVICFHFMAHKDGSIDGVHRATMHPVDAAPIALHVFICCGVCQMWEGGETEMCQQLEPKWRRICRSPFGQVASGGTPNPPFYIIYVSQNII